MIVLQNTPTQTFDGLLSGLEVEDVDLPGITAIFDIMVEFYDIDGGLHVAITYNTDLFDLTTITRMAQHLDILLNGIVDNPNRRLAELPMLTEAEHHQVLTAWNANTHELPQA